MLQNNHKISGIMIIVAAFISFAGSFEGIIIPCYLVLFGVLVAIMVFYIPPTLAAMIPFYMNFLGRGLTFLFLGSLLLVGSGNQEVKIAAAVITLIVAFLYIILWILYKFNVVPCGLPPPFLQSDNAQSSGGSKNDDNDEDEEAVEDEPAGTR